jgi:hypothetical protein
MLQNSIIFEKNLKLNTMKTKDVYIAGLTFTVEYNETDPDPSVGYPGEYEIISIYFGHVDFLQLFLEHDKLNEVYELLN